MLNQDDYSLDNPPMENDILHMVVVDELGEFDLETEQDKHKSQPLLHFNSNDPALAKQVIMNRLDANLRPLLQLLKCLAHMHGKGIFHRDFKTMSKFKKACMMYFGSFTQGAL